MYNRQLASEIIIIIQLDLNAIIRKRNKVKRGKRGNRNEEIETRTSKRGKRNEES
jgi:hypothetical protein